MKTLWKVFYQKQFKLFSSRKKHSAKKNCVMNIYVIMLGESIVTVRLEQLDSRLDLSPNCHRCALMRQSHSVI